ncbi:hypothetical protein FGO68_gene5835 [Halteria grandinella]|uniref:Uncharacterized protein n=1 Tax=Halteria grandinella TaxID=5974 RepID=A0A8J8NTU1_HALGN|nr:hypothetical protein FGO68_gene5835 [Halteria grandinella]
MISFMEVPAKGDILDIQGINYSRRDDIVCFIYTMIKFLCQRKMPWMQRMTLQEIGKFMSRNVVRGESELINKEVDSLINIILRNSQLIKFQEEPDYNFLRYFLKKIMIAYQNSLLPANVLPNRQSLEIPSDAPNAEAQSVFNEHQSIGLSSETAASEINKSKIKIELEVELCLSIVARSIATELVRHGIDERLYEAVIRGINANNEEEQKQQLQTEQQLQYEQANAIKRLEKEVASFKQILADQKQEITDLIGKNMKIKAKLAQNDQTMGNYKLKLEEAEHRIIHLERDAHSCHAMLEDQKLKISDLEQSLQQRLSEQRDLRLCISRLNQRINEIQNPCQLTPSQANNLVTQISIQSQPDFYPQVLRNVDKIINSRIELIQSSSELEVKRLRQLVSSSSGGQQFSDLSNSRQSDSFALQMDEE